MARAAAAPAPVLKDNVEHLSDALFALKQVDLRTIKDTESRQNVKTARALLTEARKGVK